MSDTAAVWLFPDDDRRNNWVIAMPKEANAREVLSHAKNVRSVAWGEMVSQRADYREEADTNPTRGDPGPHCPCSPILDYHIDLPVGCTRKLDARLCWTAHRSPAARKDS